MRSKFRRLALGMALVPCLAALAGAQGLTFEVNNSNHAEGGQYISYRPQMLRAESRDSSRVTIVRLDKGMVYMLNPRQKTYREISFDQLNARLKGEMSRLEQLKEKQLQSLTPEQRREAQQGAQTGGSMDMTGKAVATGETRTIDGHRCTKYIITGTGRQEATLWVTADVPEADTLKNDIRQLASRFSDVAARYGVLELAQNIDGFPIELRHAGMVQTFTDINRASFPPQYFEVPAGYTLVKGRQGGAASDTTQTDKE